MIPIHKEFLLLNPVTENSIDQLFMKIKNCYSPFLIINVGEHNFESITVLKMFKERFAIESEMLTRFEKIAFLHPPGYHNISENEEKYNYFTERQKAITSFSEVM